VINKNENEFIASLIQFSENKIQHADDIKYLYKKALDKNAVDEFEKTAFTAKYINGLKRVMTSGIGNPEISNIDQIKKDLADNYEKVISEIKNLCGDDEAFRKKFLELDRESFANLNSLLADLDWVKIYLNELKRKK
jgi:hypothetical protein